jgi:hypothetical protein
MAYELRRVYPHREWLVLEIRGTEYHGRLICLATEPGRKRMPDTQVMIVSDLVSKEIPLSKLAQLVVEEMVINKQLQPLLKMWDKL